MTIEKITSNYKILDSGTAITYDKESSIQFRLTFDPAFSFTVELQFENDSTGERSLKQSANRETNTINFTCINFDNSLGTGTTVPIELATYQGKKIYIHFWIYALGENSIRKADYAFYQER